MQNSSAALLYSSFYHGTHAALLPFLTMPVELRPMARWDEQLGKFRVWYICGSEVATTRVGGCYAESVDGLVWTKPLVGSNAAGGVSGTNIVHEELMNGNVVWLDHSPTVATACANTTVDHLPALTLCGGSAGTYMVRGAGHQTDRGNYWHCMVRQTARGAGRWRPCRTLWRSQNSGFLRRWTDGIGPKPWRPLARGAAGGAVICSNNSLSRVVIMCFNVSPMGRSGQCQQHDDSGSARPGPIADRSTFFYNPFRSKFVWSIKQYFPPPYGRACPPAADTASLRLLLIPAVALPSKWVQQNDHGMPHG